MTAVPILEDDRFADLEGKVCDATQFAHVAAVLAERMLGGPHDGAYVRMMPWEADLLIFSIQQAHFAAVGAERQWKDLAEGRAR